MIFKMMDKAIQVVKENGLVPVYIALYGSQNYGLDTYSGDSSSDYDFKVIVMPELHDLVFKSDKISRVIEYEGGQIDVKSAVDMAMLYKKMNQQYLETLETPFYQILPYGDYMNDIRAMLPELISERSDLMIHSIAGHYNSKSQKLFNMNEHGAIEYDAKNGYHMLRLVCMLEDYEKTGRLVLHPSADQKQMLLKVKAHELTNDELIDQRNQWDVRMRIVLGKLESRRSEPKDDAAEKMIHLSQSAWYQFLCTGGLRNVS